jgi:hypothetical protein
MRYGWSGGFVLCGFARTRLGVVGARPGAEPFQTGVVDENGRDGDPLRRESGRELGEPGEHGGESPEKANDDVHGRGIGEAEHENRIEGSGGLGSFTTGAAEACEPVGASAAAGLGDAEIGGEESSPELVGEGRIATR